MSLHESADWIVTYDISDGRRGARVLRLMKAHGLPLQYSVFLVHASSAAMHALMSDIKRLIKPANDDVRAYRVPAGAECHQLGGTRLPDGVLVGCSPLEAALLLAVRFVPVHADALV